MKNENALLLPVNEDKVIDRVIDVYLWVIQDMNTAEVIRVGQRLIDVANRAATDVEQVYANRYPTIDEIKADNPDIDFSHWDIHDL